MIFSFLIVFSSALSLIREGDDLFVSQNYRQAISIYESALTDSVDKAEIYWRISRCYINMGDVAQREEKESFYRKANEYSNLAVSSDSLSSEAHCWNAISVGYVAMYEGVRSKVKMANMIKQELDKAIELNPKNDVAYSILGTFYRALGNIGWIEKQLADLLLGGIPDGGFPEAEQALKKAIDLAPKIIRHRFELGQLYIDMGKPDDAKKVFESAIRLPPVLASDVKRIERMKKKISEF